MKLYAERLRETPTDHLLVLLQFFDDPRLRRHYVGLIGDIRRILASRGVQLGSPSELDR